MWKANQLYSTLYTETQCYFHNLETKDSGEPTLLSFGVLVLYFLNLRFCSTVDMLSVVHSLDQEVKVKTESFTFKT